MGQSPPTLIYGLLGYLLARFSAFPASLLIRRSCGTASSE